MKCVCGQDYNGTSVTPWISATMDSAGKVIRGECLHGIYFDFGKFRLEDKVEILKDAPLMSWKGAQGIIKRRCGSSFGIEIDTCCYGKVMLWIPPENLKKVS